MAIISTVTLLTQADGGGIMLVHSILEGRCTMLVTNLNTIPVDLLIINETLALLTCAVKGTARGGARARTKHLFG